MKFILHFSLYFSLCFLWLLPIHSVYAEDVDPETVYARFHEATLSQNYAGLKQHGADLGAQMEEMPAVVIKGLLWFMSKILPEHYSVVDKYISADGKRAILHLRDDSDGTPGKATLERIDGEWQVLTSNWGSEAN